MGALLVFYTNIYILYLRYNKTCTSAYYVFSKKKYKNNIGSNGVFLPSLENRT